MCSGIPQWYPYAMNTIGDYFDPEDMHHAAIRALSQHVMVRGALGLIDNRSDPLNLRAEVLGLEFRSPVGIAAGFDKNGEALRGIAGLGPGFVEVGSVTPLPQVKYLTSTVFREPIATLPFFTHVLFFRLCFVVLCYV